VNNILKAALTNKRWWFWHEATSAVDSHFR